MRILFLTLIMTLCCFTFQAQNTSPFPNNGNVGIGTLTPTGKLEIYGANANATNLVLSANYENYYKWRLKTVDRGNAIDLDFTASNSNDEQESVMKLTRSSSGRPEFQLYNDAIVANNGNVGIGTANPQYKLHVAGDVLSNKILLNDPNATTDWNLNWQSGFYESYSAENAPEPEQWFWGVNMNHRSNSADYRYNGQIAIRNSSLNPRMYFRSTDRDGKGTWSRIVHSVGDQFIDGKLGLGSTTFGSHKLVVEGSIGAREIKVQAAGWSDFVFDSDYELPTLMEVEEHIIEKGHLKDIPSAKEVALSGFYLGEMDAKLLQKIEELTLYIIEQEKKIKVQNTRISKLELLSDKLSVLQAKIDNLEIK
jgi:hypothetical protein